jgi:hypothetical protein
MLEAAASIHSFPVRIELVFERSMSWNFCISRQRYSLFVPNAPMKLSDETHVSLERKPSKFAAKASSIGLPVEFS